MERDEIKKVPLDHYLKMIGHNPVLVKTDDLWYRSPFRDEKTPSFKVSKSRNLWYDFGIGKGGDIFSFAEMYYSGPNTFSDIVALLSQDLGVDYVPETENTEEIITREHRLVITDVSDKLNYNMRSYLVSRGIVSPYLHSLCSAVYYRVGDRNYQAVGFRNDSDGYELRSRYFKGSSSPKDITSIYDINYTDTCCVFEGFIDYLSFLQIGREEFAVGNSNFIVMNSLVHTEKVLPLLRQYDRVLCFLDNDHAGKKAVSFFAENLSSVQDMSELYPCSDDLNDALSDFLKIYNNVHNKPELECDVPSVRKMGRRR